jgi:hypothetical protein
MCKQELESTQFYSRQYSCKECQKQNQKRRRVSKISKKWVRNYLSGKTCESCGDKNIVLLNTSPLRTKREITNSPAICLNCLIKNQPGRLNLQ